MKGEEIKKLRQEIATAEKDLENKKKILIEAEDACDHDWEKPVFKPKIIPAYDIPDRSRGSDYSGPLHVQEQEIPRWFQTCTKCGLTLMTEEYAESERETTRTPVFRKRH